LWSDISCLDQRLQRLPLHWVDPLVIMRLKMTLMGYKSPQEPCLLLYEMTWWCNDSESSTFFGALYCSENVEIWQPRYIH
jgi:hypothetical protein